MEQPAVTDVRTVPLSHFPKITVVTPSYNQAQFLEEAILTVRFQRYPNLEHIVIDGGSEDGSVDVIKKYADGLAHWESEKDRGQAHAINKGLQRATGEIVTFLNSDDVYLPGALNHIAYEFNRDPGLEWVSGTSVKFGEGFTRVDPPMLPGRNATRVEWLVGNWVIAPSTFFKRTVYERVGPMNEEMHFGFDYEYWVRMIFEGVKLLQIGRPVLGYRYHDASKTVTAQERFRKDEHAIRDRFLPLLTAAERSEYEHRMASFERWARFKDIQTVLDDKGPLEAMVAFRAAVKGRGAWFLDRSAVGMYLRIKKASG